MIHQHRNSKLNSMSAAIFAVLLLVSTASAVTDLDWLPADLPPDSALPVILFLESGPADLNPAPAGSRVRPTRDQRIKFVTASLKNRRVIGAEGMQSYLETHSAVPPVRHWIVPSFSATLTVTDLRSLANHPDVRRIVPDIQLIPDEPVDTRSSSTLATSISTQLQMLGVPQAWARGITGKGRLVASFDTGVDYDHPALLSKWRGNTSSLAAAWFSTLTPASVPSDHSGHGTHTMGTMVGSTDTDTIGVAPGAEWITAGVVDQGRPLSGTLSDIIAAFEWVLDPDGDPETTSDVPDVVLNSWGIPAGIFAPCDDMFYEVIDNVEAAGIVTIFSAGNEGPDASSIRTPADRATSPINTLCVGAVDNNSVVASFSSRGPSSCGSDAIKPEVVAPGVNILSCARGGGYITMSGTSMAAPYVAGLVALARQAYPDATVEEIKYALMYSATDLGPAGEDNAYGHGLVNAIAMLNYLEVSTRTDYALVNTDINDGGVPMPDQISSIAMTLKRGADDPTFVTGHLISEDTDHVTVISAYSDFYFSSGDVTASGYAPFTAAIDAAVAHGDSVYFRLALSDINGTDLDTLQLAFQVGYPPPGEIGEHASGSLVATVSDFGQFGFAPGSIYNLNGKGFEYGNSGNLMYEGGIVVAYDDGTVSSAVRGSDGLVRRSDFAPIDALTAGWMDTAQGFHRTARFTDATHVGHSEVTLRQQTIDFSGIDDDGIMLIQYFLINEGAAYLYDVRFGLLTDFDLSNGGEEAAYEEAHDLLWQTAGGNLYIGLVGMKNVSGYEVFDNGAVKRGFQNEELQSILSGNFSENAPGVPSDLLSVVRSSSFDIAPSDSAEITLALVVAGSLDQLIFRAEQARSRYFVVTDVEPGTGSLPDGFELHQNYPNPFNPTTNISFELSHGAQVRLEVYNLLGQRVAVLHEGYLGAGEHQYQWNAENGSGSNVASGVYFYRLAVAESYQTRKMVLLR